MGRTADTVKDRVGDLDVCGWIATGEVLGSAQRQAGIVGVKDAFENVVWSDFEDRGGTDKRDLVTAIFAMHHERVSRAQRLQRLGNRPQVCEDRHADNLELHARRIRERTDEIEDGPEAKLTAERSEVPQGLMVVRGE